MWNIFSFFHNPWVGGREGISFLSPINSMHSVAEVHHFCLGDPSDWKKRPVLPPFKSVPDGNLFAWFCTTQWKCLQCVTSSIQPCLESHFLVWIEYDVMMGVCNKEISISLKHEAVLEIQELACWTALEYLVFPTWKREVSLNLVTKIFFTHFLSGSSG